MTNFEITEEDFNQLSEIELNKFLISFNDGQGDNCVYNWKEVIGVLEDDNSIANYLGDLGDEDDIKQKTNIEILDLFYEGQVLDGNNSNLIYFDGEMKNLVFIN